MRDHVTSCNECRSFRIADPTTLQLLTQELSVPEKQHEKRCRDLAANLLAERAFARPSEMAWRCRNSGYFHTGAEAPQRFPACVKPQGYFELPAENW